MNKTRAYPPSKRDVMLKKIYPVFDNVLNIDPSVDFKRVLKSILSGYDVKGDIKNISKYMPFFNDNNLISICKQGTS